jgi:muramoyltetrapeptide carboxypeptidase
MRKPLPLLPGGTIGIVNPSSPCEPDRLQAGREFLHGRGFQTVAAPHVLDRYGHMAGTDADRASDFMAFYADPAIDVIWCARGGYSAYRLRSYLDWDALAALPPKMVIGYSDTTALLIPLTQRAHVVAMYGPLIFELGTKTAPAAMEWALRLLQDREPSGLVPGSADDVLTPGAAEGRLCGGCLSLVAATLGTPYQIDAWGGLLLIEDVGESPPRIERLLVQLDEAGILDEAVGFIVGEATEADDSQTLPMRQVWSDILAPFGKPTVLGFPFGHVVDNYAMPLGLSARLDADAGTITLLEAAVE